MNCELCQRKMDAYREEKLSPDMKALVEDHIRSCSECAGILRMGILADKVIEREKQLEPDPYLSTRVIGLIESSENKAETGFITILRPVLMTLSLAAAVFFGIVLGNLTRTSGNFQPIPVELALINDSAMESIEVLSIE